MGGDEVTLCVRPKLDGKGLQEKLHRCCGRPRDATTFLSKHAVGNDGPQKEAGMSIGEADDVATLRQQVKVLEAKLAQAQRLTAVGELASTTTHEFNNVLMTVINYAKLGLRHKDAATREKAFNKILSAGNRAAKITKCILGMSRNRSASHEPTNLVQLLDDTLLLLERELRKYRVAVERVIAPVPEVMADGNQIQQVLLNLLINARQAMPSGGRVVVKLSTNAERNAVELMIRDSGCGIPKDKLPKIFDSFFSTKDGPDASGKGGTGLGLSMVRDVIESHHGRIQVNSTVGKGTAFTIKLPAVAAAKVGPPHAAAPLNASSPFDEITSPADSSS